MFQAGNVKPSPSCRYLGLILTFVIQDVTAKKLIRDYVGLNVRREYGDFISST